MVIFFSCSIKRDMRRIALEVSKNEFPFPCPQLTAALYYNYIQCDVSLVAVAYSYVYFEKVVLMVGMIQIIPIVCIHL